MTLIDKRFLFPQTLNVKKVLGCDRKKCYASSLARQSEDWVLETVNPSSAGLWLQCVVLVTHVADEECTRLYIQVLKWLLIGASV